MASPLARGLFRGVIMESGALLSLPALSPYAKSDLQKSIAVSGMLAAVFGAGDDADGLEKMRRADAGALAQFSAFLPDQTLTPAFFLTPVFDGRVLPKDPGGAMSSGDFAGVHLLAGFNKDEGSLFIPKGSDGNAYKMLAVRMFGSENGQRILERFAVDAHNTVLQRARQIVAYGVFAAGTKRTADIVANAGNSVYMYTFTYAAPEDKRKGLGAMHTGELPFVFNTLAQGTASGPSAAKLAEAMHARWANFIRSGDPNIGEALPDGVEWPKYDAKNAGVLFLGEKIASGPLADRENIDFAADLTFGDGPGESLR